MSLAYDKIVLFGDSIIEGASNQEHGFCLGGALQHVYSRKLDVVLRGFGGYNSSHGALIIDHIMEQECSNSSMVALMVVFFGTNDSVFTGSNQQVPVPDFKHNLQYICHAAKLRKVKVILVGPAPFVPATFQAMHPEIVLDRSTERQREYCDAVKDVALAIEVPFVGLWYDITERSVHGKSSSNTNGSGVNGSCSQIANYLDSFFSDGLHFRGPAYKVLFDGIMRAVKETYGSLDPDRMLPKLPSYDQVVIPRDLLQSLGVSTCN